jgi:Tfp pilus assembly protein PilV
MLNRFIFQSFGSLKNNESGQSLIEVLIALLVAVLMIGAMTIATITSLRNSTFSQNQSQATKYAQESIELVRANRDRGGQVTLVENGRTVEYQFFQLWTKKMSDICGLDTCYFSINPATLSLAQITSADTTVVLNDTFKRQIAISDTATSFQKEKNLQVIITWTDSSGSHESKLTTVLTRKI